MPVFYNNFVTDPSTHTVSSCAYDFKSNLTRIPWLFTIYMENPFGLKLCSYYALSIRIMRFPFRVTDRKALKGCLPFTWKTHM
jgi:hypothetical protein